MGSKTKSKNGKTKSVKHNKDVVGQDNADEKALSTDVKKMLDELNFPQVSAQVVEEDSNKVKTKKKKSKKRDLQKRATKQGEKKVKPPRVRKEPESESEEESEESEVDETNSNGMEVDDDEPQQDKQENLKKSTHINFESSDEEEEENDDGDEEDEDEPEAQGDVADEEEENSELWFEYAARTLTPLETGDKTGRTNHSELGRLRERAEGLLQEHIETQKTGEDDAQTQWMRKVMRSGTMSDKVAAMALLVSNEPVENLSTLDNLLTIAGKKTRRRDAKLAVEALADVFINNLLPSDRPLFGFNEQVERLTAKSLESVTDDHLFFWIVEAEVKSKYLNFIQSLQSWTFDNMEFTKRMGLSTATRLLKAKPEQEQRLLMTIVNKLGDTEKKISSQVVYLLTEIAKAHPNMRGILVNEVEQFIFRPKVTPRGIYCGAIFMNQTVLQQLGDEELARRLIKIYVRLFKHLVSKDTIGGEESEDKDTFKKKTNKNGKKKRGKGKKNGKPDEVQQSQEAMKKKLLSAILTGVNRAFPYAKTMGEDMEEQIDTLFQIVHVAAFSTSTQALMLLLHIMLARKAVSDRFFRALYGKMLSPEVLDTGKQTMFLNVLYRAMKADTNSRRLSAFLKRILQVGLIGSAPFAAGVLILVSTILQNKPSMRTLVGTVTEEKPESNKKAVAVKKSDIDGEDGPKLLVDLGEDEDEDMSDESADETSETKEQEVVSDDEEEVGEYDASKREPKYAGCAKATCRLWELEPYTRHYHPSVRAFAIALARDPKGVKYEGDPMKDFSANAFLDRFVYRNPRQRDIENLKNAHKSTFGVQGRAGRLGKVTGAPAVNTPSFLLKDASLIKEEERFFHEFFHKKAENEGRDLRGEMAGRSLKGETAHDPFFHDDEDEIDEFASKLAEDMLKKQHGSADIDDDAGIDFNYSDSEDEGEEEDETGKKRKAPKDDSEIFGDSSSESGGDGEGAELDGESSSEGEDEWDDIEVDDEDDEDDNAGRNVSSFADAEEFAELLEGSGKSNKNKKEDLWERRTEIQDHASRRHNAKNKRRRR
mmetsp:Transcript_1401/g.1883  ORF Transcript_1401/g.1883 Transcript_1401/m.1883 type:complete len:1050 (-) Transcript_1401:826-3975(-)